MNKKTRNSVVLLLLLTALTGAGIGYYLYNKGPVDVQGGSAIKINAGELYQAFITDTATAQKKYSGRVLLVPGEVHGISINQQQQQIVLLKANAEGAFINCTMEENPVQLHEKDKISIRGICSGIGEGDADLGIQGDVYLTRCYLVK